MHIYVLKKLFLNVFEYDTYYDYIFRSLIGSNVSVHTPTLYYVYASADIYSRVIYAIYHF